jgi:hypothetical protein
MGIGDSIEEAAKNAMEDLAGTAPKSDDAHTPDPGDPKEDIRVHSSISEGSNAMEAEKEKAPGLKTGPAPGPVSESPLGGDTDETNNDRAEAGRGTGDDGLTGSAAAAGGAAAAGTGGPGGVAGGLPDSNPDELRADPTEGDQDPSTSTGRG